MKRMQPACPRHPGRKARRRCYQCRAPFCSLCEMRAEHHIFCGPACVRTHARQERRTRWRVRLGRPVPFRLAAGAIALTAASGMGAYLHVVDRLAAPDLPPPALRFPRPEARITRVERAAGGCVVSGTAPSGAGVALFSGGHLISVQTARNGVFLFRDVPGDGPFRAGYLPLSPEAFPPPTAVPRSSRDLLRGPAGAGKSILVSFDAGSSDRGASEILDALSSRSIRTTIFLTGEFIRRYPEIARRIAREGHEVGNHTFDHPHLTLTSETGRSDTRPGVTEETLKSELLRTAEIYRATTGQAMAPIWRAPYGEENDEIRSWARAAGYTHVSWTHGAGENLDALDWVADSASPQYRSARGVIDRLLARAQPGGIVLMHLGTDRTDDAVFARVPELLDSLASRGFRFATAGEYIRETR